MPQSPTASFTPLSGVCVTCDGGVVRMVFHLLSDIHNKLCCTFFLSELLVHSQRGSLARHAEPVALLGAGDWRPMAMRVAMIVTVAAVTCPQRTLVITTATGDANTRQWRE